LSPFIDKLYHNRARESNDSVLDVEMRASMGVYMDV
jgi:hypothetical protein